MKKNVFQVSLGEFLEEVVQANRIDLRGVLLGDAMYDFFYFDGMSYDDPTPADCERMKKLVPQAPDACLREAWISAVSNHYEATYMDEYLARMRREVEDTIVNSFKHLTDFFADELEEAGMNLEQVPTFDVQLDWIGDKLTVIGSPEAFEVILIEILRAEGWRYEDVEEFRSFNGGQQRAIDGHYQYLGSIETIYGTVYDFFNVGDLSELDRYAVFGDYDVTDAELKETLLEVIPYSA